MRRYNIRKIKGKIHHHRTNVKTIIQYIKRVKISSIIFEMASIGLSNWRLLIHADNVGTLQRLSIPLRYGENLLGRSIGFRLPSLAVSRNHCSIFVFDSSVILLDYSQNGTWLNTTFISNTEADLFESDIIRIGPFTFMLINDGHQVIDLSD